MGVLGLGLASWWLTRWERLAARAEAGYAAGPGPERLSVPGIGAVLPLICYEAVFPQYARAGGER